MKKLLIILFVISFYGCEKERCFECAATVTGFGSPYTQTTVVCGTMTRKEAKEQVASASVSGSGYRVTVRCNEQ